MGVIIPADNQFVPVTRNSVSRGGCKYDSNQRCSRYRICPYRRQSWRYYLC